MSLPPDNSPSPTSESWWPPLPVITGCLLGCLLPAYAYAEGMAILRGFGIADRRWAAFFFLIPSVVWLYHFNLFGLALLAPQLLIAVLVSGLFVRRRARNS